MLKFLQKEVSCCVVTHFDAFALTPPPPVTIWCDVKLKTNALKECVYHGEFLDCWNCSGEVDYYVQSVKRSRWSSSSGNIYHQTETCQCHQPQNYRPYYWLSNSAKQLIKDLTIKRGLVHGSSHESPILSFGLGHRPFQSFSDYAPQFLY